MSPLRRSPLAAFKDAGDALSAPQGPTLTLRDHSLLPRVGLKGKNAGAWLAQAGLLVPETPNSWLVDQGTLIVRLGFTEFLIEGPIALSLDPEGTLRTPAVYPLARQDVVLALSGSALPSLLAQGCPIDLASLVGAQQNAVLTTLIGIHVLLLGNLQTPTARCLLWADNTYGRYLAETCRSLTQELGGRMTLESSDTQEAETFIRSFPHLQGNPT